ncbi:chemotaxis response regulator protein-glutamate methylesterase [Bacillus shivajii]|nr:chemotaxis response regulator protein-glutamate methylesterase [Bacillus shivajii]
MINVLVVDDSAFMRKMISDFLNSDPSIQVIGKARNGKEAIEKNEELKPDVITLDVEMPVINGIDALKSIMSNAPTPTIMLSSTTKEGAETTIEAMELGAFDFIAKPSGSISLDIHKVTEDLITKVKLAAKMKVSKLSSLPTVRKRERTVQMGELSSSSSENGAKKSLVAIGTSTGGPKALQEVLTVLPENFPLPILVVQHMPRGFTKSLSQRLNTLSNIAVKEAEDGDFLQKGTAYIAPGGKHLTIKRMGTSFVIKLDDSDQVNGHRPSVDKMFESISDYKMKVIAVILTGMGSDGTNGLLQLKNNNETVAIAESEQTSIVYGMPKSAIQTNKVDFVLNVEDIAPAIIDIV